MSLKDQFTSAKAYIDAGDYDRARRILRSIDHPKAKEWLERLDRQRPRNNKRRVMYVIVAALLILAACSIAFYVTQVMPASSQELIILLTQQAIEYGN